MKRILFLFFSFLSVFPAISQNYENIQVSLLTVEPRPNAVYTIFGHTALRISDQEQNIDIVLNWGMFSFDEPNFIYRFLIGETDYYLGTSPYNYFIYGYSMGNSSVTEQILNIPEEKKKELIRIIEKNLLPENVEYRYNFLFDNCTSRVRDIIEEVVGNSGKFQLVYPEQEKPITFRELIHEYTAPYPWLEFGIDLLIGNGADSLVCMRNELWLPEKLQKAYDHSFYTDNDGNKQNLVISSKSLLQSKPEKKTSLGILNSPTIMGFILFFIISGIIFAAYKMKRRFRIPLALLFLFFGVGGCIVAITGFVSTHPCTWPNWNIAWINPLLLIGFAGFFSKRIHKWSAWYHGLNFVLLSMVLLAWYWIPQGMNIACIPFILCIWLVSGFQYFAYKKKIYE